MSANLLRHIPKTDNEYQFSKLIEVSPTTYEKYRANLRLISQWLDQHQYPDTLPIAPEILETWLNDAALSLKPNTITQRVWSIAWLHHINGIPDKNNPVYHPSNKRFSHHVKKYRASRHLDNRINRKEPLYTEDIKNLCRQCKKDLRGYRDRALLLLAFVTAGRRSELAELTFNDIKISRDKKSALVSIGKSKGDQLGEGQTITIFAGNNRYCALASLEKWKQEANIQQGPIFRTIIGNNQVQPQALHPNSISGTIKKYCLKAGYDPDLYAGHSTRRGMLTTAANKGCPINELRTQARHKHSSMTEYYIGYASDMKRNPTRGILN